MQLVLDYYDVAGEALKKGASIDRLVSIPVREQIGQMCIRDRAAAALDEAGAQSEAMMTEALGEVEQEVLRLGENVAAKEKQAVEQILAELLKS